MSQSKHPDSAELASFLSGNLDGGASAVVQAHLDGCEECQASALSAPEDPFSAEVRAVWGRFHTDESRTVVGLGLRGPAHGGPIPLRLGEFQLVRVIGRGGMGVVYEATQLSLGRSVALKVLSPHAAQDSRYLSRFHREAHLAARLHHANIIPVFGVGEHEGTHYYVMQLIRGRGLDQLIRGLAHGRESVNGQEVPRFLDPRFVARIALQATEALAYAHSQGVLHRDIKPSNLLLDDAGGVWVGDFGLANGTSELNLTGTGDSLGTFRYMAPERFNGTADARSDLYALGLTLYELLVARPAFEETDQERLIQRVLIDDPASPRKINPHIPRDLETIVLRASDRDPGRRYPTALALADDLQRFLDDRPILARRARTIEKIWRWCRRNPVVAGLLSALAVCVIVGTSIVTWK